MPRRTRKMRKTKNKRKTIYGGLQEVQVVLEALDQDQDLQEEEGV